MAGIVIQGTIVLEDGSVSNFSVSAGGPSYPWPGAQQWGGNDARLGRSVDIVSDILDVAIRAAEGGEV